MRRAGIWRVIGLVLCAVLTGTTALALSIYPKANYAFRLTIRILVGDEVRSGSSVIAVAAHIPPRTLPGGGNFITKVQGEAVFVDLGPRGNLIAVLGCGPNGADDCIALLPLRALGFWIRDDSDMKRLSTLSGSAELKGQDIPTLVTFGDPADPSTARVVRPDELPAIFGPEVRFGGAFLEMTSGPTTSGIAMRLPWVGNYQAETVLERRLRATGMRGGGSLMPGTKLKRK
jgi:hypothetical protein